MTYQQKKEAARQKAIDWQHWQAAEILSYGELADACEQFERLAHRFGLIREFRENGII